MLDMQNRSQNNESASRRISICIYCINNRISSVPRSRCIFIVGSDCIVGANQRLGEVMPNQYQTDSLYMDIASRVAQESYCQRRKVGAVIVTPSLATVIGYNGTPSGADNICELPDGTTRPDVIHAEDNAIQKAISHGINLYGSTCYVTLSPCQDCAILLAWHGVTRVVYSEQYRCTKGLQLLSECGVMVEQYQDSRSK